MADCFKPSLELVQLVRKNYNLSENDVKRDIDIIKLWIRQQKHLPQDITDSELIERFLIRNKFQIERTKSKIDAYYTLRGLYKELFINNEHIYASNQPLIYCPVGLTDTGSRITILQFRDKNPKNFDIVQFMKYSTKYSELFLKCDYSYSLHVILDLEGMTFDHLTKMMTSPATAAFAKIYQGAYVAKLEAMNIVNGPSFITGFVAFLKAFLSEKLTKRIKVHKDLNSLYEVIPSKYLPKDYGGAQKCFNDYISDFDLLFKENAQYLKEILKHISNEDLRVEKLIQSDLYGFEGTFKKLNID